MRRERQRCPFCRRARSPTRFSIAWSRCSVDARETLRRYLEQRRELGETELVLDGLTVDEAMKLLGAAGGGGKPAVGRSRRTESPPAPRAPSAPDEASGAESADWRATLRESERAARARDVMREPATPPAAAPS